MLFYIILAVVILILTRLYLNQQRRKWLWQIYDLLRASRLKEAKKQIKKFVKKYPYSTGGWIVMASITIELMELRLAKFATEKALKLSPNSDKALTSMGVIMRYRGDFNQAEDYYYKALRINSSNYQAKSSLMLLELYKENYETAIALGEDSIVNGLSTVDIAIVGNLLIAYHLSGDEKKRDVLFNYLRVNEYKDLAYLMLLIDGEINFGELFEIKFS